MNNAMKEIRYQQWAQMIIDRKSSHLTVAEYCAAHDIRPDQYRYRAKAVRKYALDLIPVEFRPKYRRSEQTAVDGDAQLSTTLPEAAATSSKVVEIKGTASAAGSRSGLVIQFHDAFINVPEGTSKKLLEDVCEVLAHVK